MKIDLTSPAAVLEERVAECWRIALHRRTVGANDNFFELGGTSLHAIQLYRQLQERLDMNCSVLAIFQFPTVRSFVCALLTGELKVAKGMAIDASAQPVTTQAPLVSDQNDRHPLPLFTPEARVAKRVEAIQKRAAATDHTKTFRMKL